MDDGRWTMDDGRWAAGGGEEAYRESRAFPSAEQFGLTAQLRRGAISIPSNIAEGHSRLGAGDFRRFVSIARGSGGEVEMQLAVAIALDFTSPDELVSLLAQLNRLSKMLYGLYRSLT